MERRPSPAKICLIGLGLALLALGAAPRENDAALWLAGYSRAVSGDTIRYHSSLPRANVALIARATTGDKPIEWQTDPVPGNVNGSTVTFVWLAGMGTGKGSHSFDLSIDGRPSLTLTTTEGPSPLRREFSGPDGASLVFRATLTDQFQEVFGPMTLTVPASLCRPGKPLNLRIAGPKADSPDWIMVFQHRLEERTTAQPEQALVRKGKALYQPVRVEVEHLGPPVEAELSLPGATKLKATVEPGGNAFELDVPAVAALQNVSLSVRLGRNAARALPLSLKPVVRREFYLLPHSHNDIGYSDIQVKVEKDQWRYLEEGIALARKTDAYPEGARFKWNVEILWPIESYLVQASEAKRREFVEAVKKGWVGLEAPLANELTGLMGGEEFFHLTDFARKLVKDYGLPPLTTGMISDIPGSTWSLVPGLALGGIKYFSSGPNYVPFLPDGGDRIGFTSKGWGDKPFYWVSASGDRKILFWMAGRGYSWFHGLNQGNLGQSGEEPILEYARELEENGYPYSLVQVRYTVGGDNGPPDPKLSDMVKAWNAKYESPRLVISTSRELFEALEKRHADSIPSFSGDMTPYWEDGAMSSARETVLNQNAKDRLLQAEALWAMLDPAGFPADAAYQGWRQALMYDEHTWGAWNSISAPDAAEVKTQWDYKRAFALEADRISRDILDKALRRGAAAPPAADTGTGPAVAVYNTSSWPRTDLVLIPAALSQAGDRVVDGAGRDVRSQRLSTGELAVLAQDVPAFGAKRLIIQKGQAWAPAGAGAAEAAGNTLANDKLRVIVDRASGAISSLVWKERNIELVDGRRDMGLNDYFYVPGYDPKRAVRNTQPRVTVKERGPLVASLLIESLAPGCKSLAREIRLVQGLDRVMLANSLDKSQVRTKESAHFAFPFQVPDGTIRVDAGWGIVRPGADQLAGACLDYLSVQNWADVSGRDYGVTLAVPDAPLVEPGEITDETRNASGTRSWRKDWTGGTTLFSYIINNYWHTNYRSDQEGPLTFRYALAPHGLFDAAQARRFGTEISQPLLVAASAASSAAGGSLVEVSPATVLAASVKPSQDGKAVMVRLYGASGRPEKAQVRVPGAGTAKVFVSNLLEEKLLPVDGPIDVPAFGIVTLRLEK